MPVRTSMASLIARTRLLINDVSAAIWTDQSVQDVLDAGRVDILNQPLRPVPTYSGGSLLFLDYFHALGDWEDDYILKQYLTVVVTPSSAEPIVGHWVFSSTTLPPVTISGKSFDLYRAAADLLERQAAQWALSYTVNVDGQSLARSQVLPALQALAKSYRMQQRPISISLVRSDLGGGGSLEVSNPLGPRNIDMYASGDGR